VVAVGHDCDLALLTVTDPDFWATPGAMLPLELGEVPALQESVLVCGYPTGGDNTSITSGVVSRVEVGVGGGKWVCCYVLAHWCWQLQLRGACAPSRTPAAAVPAILASCKPNDWFPHPVLMVSPGCHTPFDAGDAVCACCQPPDGHPD
jgi:hypothetical protein